MPLSAFDYYQDFSALPAGDFVDADFTVYAGALEILDYTAPEYIGLFTANPLSNDPADATNVVKVGYTADTHAPSASIGVKRAYPGDGSDSTIAVTLGASGAGYNFSSSLGTENCYAARWLGSALLIYRIENGSAVQVGPSIISKAPADGDEFVLQIVRGGSSDTITILVNDVNMVEYVDNTPLTFSGAVASLSFKGQSNLNSSFYGIGINGVATVSPDVTLGPDEALVQVADPVTDTASIFNQLASGTIATGDYVQHTDAANTTVNADGTFTQIVDGNFDARVWDATDETWGQWVTIKVNPPVAQVPQGTVTIGVITKGETTASIPFTYDLSDQTGFEYRLGAGQWQSAANPISLSSLNSGTGYSGQIRPINAEGPGTAANFSFTTNGQAPVNAVWVMRKMIRSCKQISKRSMRRRI